MYREALDRDLLLSVVRGRVLFDEPLSKHTTLRVGGPVDALVYAQGAADVQAAARFAAQGGLPFGPLGGGSNLLVRDGGVRGILVSTHDLRAIRIDRPGGTIVEAEAGATTARLLHATLDWQLGGLEFLAGVPGSVGGGLIMNAGTYLGEFKDVTVAVTSVAHDGNLIVRDAQACGFVYRGSALPAAEIVVCGRFALRPRDRAAMQVDIDALRAQRNEREPKGLPNAGSFFKNPPGDYAGRLIESAGLKGTQVGAAQVSPVHANWLVNLGGARATDFLRLVDLVRRRVQEQSGVSLDLEVRIMGSDPTGSDSTEDTHA